MPRLKGWLWRLRSPRASAALDRNFQSNSDSVLRICWGSRGALASAAGSPGSPARAVFLVARDGVQLIRARIYSGRKENKDVGFSRCLFFVVVEYHGVAF